MWTACPVLGEPIRGGVSSSQPNNNQSCADRKQEVAETMEHSCFLRKQCFPLDWRKKSAASQLLHIPSQALDFFF